MQPAAPVYLTGPTPSPGTCSSAGGSAAAPNTAALKMLMEFSQLELLERPNVCMRRNESVTKAFKANLKPLEERGRPATLDKVSTSLVLLRQERLQLTLTAGL